MKNFIRVQQIYKEIAKFYEWNDQPDIIDIDSKYKLLRNKFSYLIKNILCRDISHYKMNNVNLIPKTDAPVIKELLINAVSENKDNIIRKWFNNKVDLSKPENSIELYNLIEETVLCLYIDDEIDEVTTKEWLSTISAAINYNTAHNTLRIINELENFRQNSLALDNTIGAGEIIISNENNERFFHSRPRKRIFDIQNKTIPELLNKVGSQDDYFDILAQVIHLLEEHVQKQAIDKITYLAKLQNSVMFEHVDDGEDNNTLSSEYIIWFQRIYEFLKNNPEICKK